MAQVLNRQITPETKSITIKGSNSEIPTHDTLENLFLNTRVVELTINPSGCWFDIETKLDVRPDVITQGDVTYTIEYAILAVKGSVTPPGLEAWFWRMIHRRLPLRVRDKLFDRPYFKARPPDNPIQITKRG
jgi:hypothetical protein